MNFPVKLSLDHGIIQSKIQQMSSMENININNFTPRHLNSKSIIQNKYERQKSTIDVLTKELLVKGIDALE